MKQFEKFAETLSGKRENITDRDIKNLEYELLRMLDERVSFIFPVQLDEETVEKYGHHIISEEMGPGVNFSFLPAYIKADDGKNWIVVYTSRKKINEEQSFSTMTGYIDLIFRMATEHDDCGGIVINPDDDFVTLPRELIEIVMEDFFDADEEEYYEDIYEMMEDSGLVYDFKGEEILELTVTDEPWDKEMLNEYTGSIMESVDCNEISAVIYGFSNGDALQYCGGEGFFSVEYVKMTDDKPYINMLKMPRRSELEGDHTFVYCGEEMSEKNTDVIPGDKLAEIIGFALSAEFDCTQPDCVDILCSKLNLSKDLFIITDDGLQQIE